MITLNTVILSVLCFIALWIVRTLYLTSNGILRKIMIGYFASEAWLMIGLMLMITFPALEQVILLFAVLPKFVSKIVFYNYTNKK